MFGNVSEWVGDYYSLNPYDGKKIYEDLVNSRPSKSNVIKELVGSLVVLLNYEHLTVRIDRKEGRCWV